MPGMCPDYIPRDMRLHNAIRSTDDIIPTEQKKAWYVRGGRINEKWAITNQHWYIKKYTKIRMARGKMEGFYIMSFPGKWGFGWVLHGCNSRKL